MGTLSTPDLWNHLPRPPMWPFPGEPAESWDSKNDKYLSPSYGRNVDEMLTEDQVFPTTNGPKAMDFQAPLHTPYGTAERTWEGFWGENRDGDLSERRPLMPFYTVAENSWDRNPREEGIQFAGRSLQPYEGSNSTAGVSAGAEYARTVGVRELSGNRYYSFVQKTNPTAYFGDPIVGQGAGGQVPILGPYLGKKGTPKPLAVPDYLPPSGGAMPSAGPQEPYMRLPGATRSNRQYEERGNVTGGNAVSAFGDESLNPQVGGRPSLFAIEYEDWGRLNGGFVASGADLNLWNPNDGARYRMTTLNGPDDPIFSSGGVAAGPSLDQTPMVGGRESMLLNFDQDGGGGAQSGIGSGLQQNPQVGGRLTRLINFDQVGSGGSLSGVGSGLQQNPQKGGRNTRLLNFDRILSGGAQAGIGSSLQQNPQVGGRASMLKNFDTTHHGGSQNQNNGLETNDIKGGNRWTKTEGWVGYVSPAGAKNPDYGGIDIAFGLEVQPRAPRTELPSSLIAGASGRGGGPKMPEMFITLPNTQKNGDGVYDDTPDPILQISARRTLGAQRLLDFTKANLDDLSFTVPCV